MIDRDRLEPGPMVSGRRLRRTLRQIRERQGATQEEVVRALSWSMAKLVRIEGGKSGIFPDDLRRLMDLYGVNDTDQRSELLRIAWIAKQRPWWSEYRLAMAYGSVSFIGMEAEAQRIESFEISLIPGLLQTRRYTESLLLQAGGDPALQVHRVELRQRRRREITKRAEKPVMTYVVDEAALWRGPQSADTMIEQLESLHASQQTLPLTLRILPFTAGFHPALGGSFTLLDLGDGDEVVYQEISNEERFYDAAPDVRHFQAVFARLLEISLTPDQSQSLIDSAGEALYARRAGKRGNTYA